jgi:hypothetical protein
MTVPRTLGIVLVLMAAAVAAPPPVHYADGRLSTRLEGEDLSSVLQAVAAEARLEIRGAPATPQTVSIVLDQVPLAEALTRLLAKQSFLFIYGAAGLKGVKILAGSDAVPPLPAMPARTQAVAEPSDVEPSSAQLASSRPVSIGGRLARAVGTDQTTFNPSTT